MDVSRLAPGGWDALRPDLPRRHPRNRDRRHQRGRARRTVTATHVGTGLVRTAVTDAAGTFAFSELPLGDWNVTASLTGFASQTAKGVRVEASSVRRVDFVLEAGGRAESVDVVARSALVDSTGNTQGGTISGEQAAELPVNGRDFTKLLSMVPGTAADPSSINDSPGSFGLFSANGNRGRSNNYLLDGTDMNDGYRNLPAINQGGVFGTPVHDPARGRGRRSSRSSPGSRPSTGATPARSSTSSPSRAPTSFHGSVFEYFRDESLGARNYFNFEPQPKNEFRNNQFGASLGGPIVKDRTFFFLAYEGQRERRRHPGAVPRPDRGRARGRHRRERRGR